MWGGWGGGAGCPGSPGWRRGGCGAGAPGWCGRGPGPPAPSCELSSSTHTPDPRPVSSAAAHPPAIRPPSLQLFDAHHEVEVPLGVLLDDVPHIVGLPSLLRAERRSPQGPHSAHWEAACL